jgi:hypothetical protein
MLLQRLQPHHVLRPHHPVQAPTTLLVVLGEDFAIHLE